MMDRNISQQEAQGLQFFNIRLGPIDKETVNTLMSKTLVSVDCHVLRILVSSQDWFIAYMPPTFS